MNNPHVEISANDYQALYTAVGFIVVQWSFVETLIDACVAVIYQKAGGKEIAYKNQIPRSLKIKIDFLKNCLQNINRLSSFTEDGILLLNRTSTLSKDRHDMIHSCISSVSPNTFHFHKLDYTKFIHKNRRLKFTVDDFYQSGKKMMGLVKDLTDFCNRLLSSLVL